jgi:hypothetical protein
VYADQLDPDIGDGVEAADAGAACCDGKDRSRWGNGYSGNVFFVADDL